MGSLNDNLGIAFVAATVIAIYLIFRRTRKVFSGTANNRNLPRCAKCRYPLVAVSSERCPECGSDVSVSGVVPPNSKLGKILAPALWTLAWVLCTTLLSFNVPYRLIFTQRETTLLVEMPGYPICARADLNIYGHEYSFSSTDSFSAPAKRAVLVLDTPTKIKIDADFSQKTYTITGDPTAHPFDRADLLARLSALGVNTADPAGKFQADQLFNLLEETGKLRHVENARSLVVRGMAMNFQISGGGGGLFLSTVPFFFFIFPVALILWTIGMLIIIPRQLHVVKGAQALSIIAYAAPTHTI